MSDYESVAAYLDELVARITGADYDGDYAAAVDEYADPEYLEKVDPAEYEDGLKKVLEHWQVPTENRFIWPQGHFSLPIALTRNDAPLRRFQQVVSGLA